MLLVELLLVGVDEDRLSTSTMECPVSTVVTGFHGNSGRLTAAGATGVDADLAVFVVIVAVDGGRVFSIVSIVTLERSTAAKSADELVLDVLFADTSCVSSVVRSITSPQIELWSNFRMNSGLLRISSARWTRRISGEFSGGVHRSIESYMIPLGCLIGDRVGDATSSIATGLIIGITMGHLFTSDASR